MALFKMLRGAENNLAANALHDGWAYFTPDAENFYIDASGARIWVNQKASTIYLSIPQGMWSDRGTYYSAAFSWSELKDTINLSRYMIQLNMPNGYGATTQKIMNDIIYAQPYILNNTDSTLTIGAHRLPLGEIMLALTLIPLENNNDVSTQLYTITYNLNGCNNPYTKSLIKHGESLNMQFTGQKENLFDIAHPDVRNGACTWWMDGSDIIIQATGTNGAQYLTYIIDNCDASATYNFTCKGKKTTKGTAGNPGLKVVIQATNDKTNYNQLYYQDYGSSTVENQEYIFSKTGLTGYTCYRFWIYNNASTPVAVGEASRYYGAQFVKNSTWNGSVTMNSTAITGAITNGSTGDASSAKVQIPEVTGNVIINLTFA